jgi:hypothetical protein
VDFLLQRRLALKNHKSWRWDIFGTNKQRQRLFFGSQWEESSDDKNEERKSAKLTFHHVARKKDILGYTDAAQLQRRSSDAVMITADVLTAHFGIHRRCAATFSDPTGWDGVKKY